MIDIICLTNNLKHKSTIIEYRLKLLPWLPCLPFKPSIYLSNGFPIWYDIGENPKT